MKTATVERTWEVKTVVSNFVKPTASITPAGRKALEEAKAKKG